MTDPLVRLMHKMRGSWENDYGLDEAVLIFQVAENRSTGYVWEISYPFNCNVSIGNYESFGPQYIDGKPVIGVGGYRPVYINQRFSRDWYLELELRRPWEEFPTPIRTLRIDRKGMSYGSNSG